MKSRRLIAGALAVTALAGLSLTGCTKTDDAYFNMVSRYSFWDNTEAQSIPQYQYYHIMDDFLSQGSFRTGRLLIARAKFARSCSWAGTAHGRMR